MVFGFIFKVRATNELTTNCDVWTKRNLTPIGKITAIRSLMLAKIVHILIALPDPDMPEIKKLETLFYKFLWNKKPDKIKREIIVQKLKDRGLNMPDVKQFLKS